MHSVKVRKALEKQFSSDLDDALEKDSGVRDWNSVNVYEKWMTMHFEIGMDASLRMSQTTQKCVSGWFEGMFFSSPFKGVYWKNGSYWKEENNGSVTMLAHLNDVWDNHYSK
tara:strand:- start:43 stop:378 length:336 start_codon:yes stop_codon:yes gene_type:complete